MIELTILQFPFVARNDDFVPLHRDPRVRLKYARLTHDWGRPDAILLPGGSRTAEAMAVMHRLGASRRLQGYLDGGGVILGICGGYQMLGEAFEDPDAIDGRRKRVRGLGMLPVVTRFARPRLACLTTAESLLPELPGAAITGRESRYGRSEVLPHRDGFLDWHRVVSRSTGEVRAGEVDGLVRADRQVWGTYLHRIFANPAWNDWFFEMLHRRRADSTASGAR